MLRRIFLFAVALLLSAPAVPAAELTAQIRPLSGGLVVQIGAADLLVPQALGNTGRFLVQVLDIDAKAIDEARRSLRAAGLSGLVSADILETSPRLPYAENLVNLLILDVSAGAKIEPSEAMRVLCPGGAVIAPAARKDAFKAAGFNDLRIPPADNAWLVAQKPWPAEMDSWPQPRHGADGNAASCDRIAGPPRRIRWIAGPDQEISNMVCSAGRNFYGGVLARDGFNGLRLWQHKLNPSPARGGYKFGFGIKAIGPAPIAIGTDLLAYSDGRVVALDGATGRPIREYPEAGTPREMLTEGGLLLSAEKNALNAIDIETGRLRWKHIATEPRCIIAGDGMVFLLEGSNWNRACDLVACDLASGKVRWRRQEFSWLRNVRSLVYHQGVLACEISTLSNDKDGNGIELLSVKDGRPIRSIEFLPSTSHWHQGRAIFVNDLMWYQAKEGWTGMNWITGGVESTFRCGTGHCFPPVATSRYLLAGEMHFTDVSSGSVDVNPITKGNCSRDGGFMPANGLIYTAPKHCICWPMLRGYTALAPAADEPKEDLVKASPPPLRRGTAQVPRQVAADAEADWPCYRHDEWRSGSTPATIPTRFKVRWSRTLTTRPAGPIADEWRDDPYTRGPLTPPVIAAGKVYLAQSDTHELLALDADTGKEQWRFIADGRIDTPPTIHNGLCLFGSSCGYVYCLRADTGQIVWRFRAAPAEQRIVVYGQVESPWPVPGSVLVVDDVAYIAAGRHSLADGGIRIFALEPASGKVIWSQVLDSVPQANFYNSSGLEFDNFDLLHREGNYVSMSRWLFDRKTGKMATRPKAGFVHLTTGASGVIVPRGFWSYAPREESEHNSERPFVRPLLSFRDDCVYGLSEDRRTLFRRDFDAAEVKSFNREWFKGWTTYSNAREGGDLWRTQRLSRGAAWNVNPFSEMEGRPRGGAIALAKNAILAASQQGGLIVLNPEDGTVLSRLEIPPVRWDGMAIGGPRVYVSTQDGQILCLEGR